MILSNFTRAVLKAHKKQILPHVRNGTDNDFLFRRLPFYGVPPKNWRYSVIWPKNDAKQEKEKEKEKKENVGIFSVNSSFFLARKKKNVITARIFHFVW